MPTSICMSVCNGERGGMGKSPAMEAEVADADLEGISDGPVADPDADPVLEAVLLVMCRPLKRGSSSSDVPVPPADVPPVLLLFG